MTLFSKIIAGEIPSYKCGEDDRFYAFLDISPLRQGHTLVVPKREEDYLFDLTDEEMSALGVFTKRMARAIQTAFPCRKVAAVVLGLEVPHAHVHLIPMDSEADVDFRRAHLSLADDVMQQTADKIRAAFEAQS